MRRYDFTPSAQEVLQRVPLELKNEREPLGGGLWYPTEQRVVLNGVQDEACLHELTHAWADLTQFYVDPHPDNPRLKGRHYAFRRDVERAAGETDPRYRRVAFLAWEYTWGNPATGFEGMREYDWERFAGLASGVMGDTRLMPPYLSRWYADLFGGNPSVPGPSEIPHWAPRGWRQGQAGPSDVRPPAVQPPLRRATIGDAVRRFWSRLTG
jgi:hypothetical protein